MPDETKPAKATAADPSAVNPMFLPRYTDIATFMRTPLQRDPRGLDIALCGVPFDLGVTNRPGARHGPGSGSPGWRR